MSDADKATTKKSFIIIDDDKTANFFCKIIIKKTFGESNISTYINPLLAVEYFQKSFIKAPTETIILLDINMPELSGWEVLEQIENLDIFAKSCLKIFLLSSSIDVADKKRAADHPIVLGYIEKPISIKKLREILTDI